LKILVSTFGEGDLDKVLMAMRGLAFERLVLIGNADLEDSVEFRKINRLEEMAGHGVEFESVSDLDFMEAVEHISAVLSRELNYGGRKNSVALNISGGSKLLGDAAIFAAFRLGVETYHCDTGIVRLPVMKGVTMTDRYTETQAKFIMIVGSGAYMDDIVKGLMPTTRQAVERVLRILRREEVIETELRSGRIHVRRTKAGEEVARALKLIRSSDIS